MVEIVHSTKEISLKQFFFKDFALFGPYDAILTPKTALFEHLSNFSQISAFLTTLKWKLSHKTKVEIVHNTLEIVSNKFFLKFFDHSGPMTSS